MKKNNILLVFMAIIFGTAAIGQFTTNASETDSADAMKTEATQELSTEQETESATQVSDTNLEDKTDKPDNNEMPDLDMEPAEGIMDQEDDADRQDIDEVDIEESLYYQGLRYYLTRYEYECELTYLQSYLAYVKLEVAASENMYDMGELTEADVKGYEAQQSSIEAQIQVAKNQIRYNGLFLEEHNLDYQDYVVKEKKDVKSIDSYIEQFPAKDHMTMAGYVTSYQNALAYIEAKKVEIEYTAKKLDSSKLLYEAGEVSELELKQQETALAKAQYEMEQYYVEMNLAYVNIKTYCR
ncbi:MAG: hypothetical protein NC347_06030 [Clostridium sp.]|nr:hypothetical protein [Clostridium sp.]